MESLDRANLLGERAEAGTIYTKRIHGEEWTLKSYGPVVGARHSSKPWDVMNVIGLQRPVSFLGIHNGGMCT